MKRHQKLRKIINHYGVNKQLKQFNEEVFELNEAIIKYQNSIPTILEILDFMNSGKSKRQHVVEEMADVLVMIKQFQLKYDIKTEELNKVMKYKIDRQLERIEKEKPKGLIATIESGEIPKDISITKIK